MSEVGKRLKEERDKKHLTQVQVFTKTGINNKTLSGYENGVSYPDYGSLKILADYYEVSTDYLLGVEIKDSSIEETKLDIKTKKLLSNVEELKNDPSNIDFLIEMSNKMLGK